MWDTYLSVSNCQWACGLHGYGLLHAIEGGGLIFLQVQVEQTFIGDRFRFG